MTTDTDDPKHNAEVGDICTLYNQAASYYHKCEKKKTIFTL